MARIVNKKRRRRRRRKPAPVIDYGALGGEKSLYEGGTSNASTSKPRPRPKDTDKPGTVPVAPSAAPTGGAPGGVPPSITPAQADKIIRTPTVSSWARLQAFRNAEADGTASTSNQGESGSQGESDNEGPNKWSPKSVAESQAKAEDQRAELERKIDELTSSEAKRRRKYETDQKVNEIAKPAIDAQIEDIKKRIDKIDPGAGNRKTSFEAMRLFTRKASVKQLEHLRDAPGQQKARDLYAAMLSDSDWKQAREEGLGVTTGIVDPWRGKKTDEQKRKAIRRLVNDDSGVDPLPSQQQAEVDMSNFWEEAIGLGMSPVDVALMVPGLGTVGKLGKAGLEGVKTTRKLADAIKVADNLDEMRLAGDLAFKSTKTGKKVKKYRDFMDNPLVKGKGPKRSTVARVGRTAPWLGAAGAAVATGQADDMVKGTVQANVADASKATFRSIISMFAAPLTMGAALTISGKRAAEKATGGNDDTWGEVAAPTTELGKQYASEFQKMLETYWTGSAEDIAKMTSDDYGYIGPLNATVMTAAAFTGLGGPIFRNTIGELPYKRGEHGVLDGPTINEFLDRASAKGRLTVVNTRALGMKEETVKKVTKRFEKSRKVLNRFVLNNGYYAAKLKGLEDWNNRRRKDKVTGGTHRDIDIATIVVYPLIKGLKRKLDRDTIESLIASDRHLDAEESDILQAALRLPDDVWDPSTKIGKHVARMQKAFEEDIHPYLTRGEMDTRDLNALKMESLVTVEQKTRGEYERGLRDDVQEAPEHPVRTGDRRYDELVNKNYEDLAKNKSDLAKKVYKLKRREKRFINRKTAGERVQSIRAKIGAIEQHKTRRRLSDREKKQLGTLRGQLRNAQRDLEDWNRMSQLARGRMEEHVKTLRAEAAMLQREQGNIRAEGNRLAGRPSDAEQDEIRVQVEDEIARITDPEAHLEKVRAETNAVLDGDAPLSEKLRAQKRLEDMEDLIAEGGHRREGGEETIEDLRKRRQEINAEISRIYSGNGEGSRRKQRQRLQELDAELRAQQPIVDRLHREERTDIRTDLLEKKSKLKREEKVQAIKDALVKEAQIELDELFKARMDEHDMELAYYVPWRELPKAHPEEVATGHIGQTSIPKTHQRLDATLAKAGKVDRRIESIIKAVNDKAEREKNRLVAAHVERNGMFSRIDPKTGKQQIYFTPDELDEVMTDKLRRTHVLMDEEIFADPGHKIEDSKGKETTAWAEGWKEPGTSEIQANRRYALVEKGMADRIAAQEQQVSKFWEGIGRWSSKLTLGTSVGWALTQPFAEALTLMASHPNPVEWRKAWLVRQKILAHDPEAASLLRYASGTTLGTNVVTTARLRNYNAVGRTVEQMKSSPEAEIMRSIVHLDTLGQIDRWKGAAIRELGAIMEIDRNLKRSVRMAKATLGQMDALEKIADKMDALGSYNEVLRYMFSNEGIRDAEQLTRAQRDWLAAGDLLATNIDRQQGNWTAVRPGVEQGLAQVMFFYPFTRFSLQWTFKNYPADHPARYTALTSLGAFQGNMLEDVMGDNAQFITDWAMIPIYGPDGKIITMTPVSRLMGTGNAALETVGGLETPADIVGPLVPIIPALVNALASQDQYGTPLRHEDGTPLGSSLDDWLVRAGQFGNQMASLSPLYREAKRMGLNLNQIPGVNADVGFAHKRSRMVGDDPNETRGFLRRMFGPVADPLYAVLTGNDMGIPAEVLRDKALNQASWDGYLEGGDGRKKPLSDAAKKAEAYFEATHKRLKSDRSDGGYWKDKLKDAAERYGEWPTTYFKLKYKFNKEVLAFEKWKSSDPGYRQLLIEQAAKDQAGVQQDSAAYALWRLAKMAGVDPPDISEDALKRGTEMWQGHMPEQPQKIRDPESANMVIPGSPQDVGDYDPDYWAGTVPQGGRAWRHMGPVGNLAFERRDPKDGELKFTKPGDTIEADVMNVFDEETSWADTGGIDPDKIMKRVQAFEPVKGLPAMKVRVPKNAHKAPAKSKYKVANRILDLKEAVNASTQGVPSKVPDQYKAAVGKWGAWLEKEMRKNGLVEKDASFVGPGLPAGMSGAEYLAKIIQAESNWDASASSAVASGLGQFIPGTRQALMDRTGTDAWSDNPEEQVKAVAELLSGSVPDFEGTMDHYNPGFPSSGDNPYKDGTWRYYFGQDVGQLTGGGKKPDPKLTRQMVEAMTLGKAMGIFEEPSVSNAPVKLDTSAAGTDLKGVKRPVKVLAKYLARSIGEQKLDILSGKSNHSVNTVGGNVSEHSVGDALDITAYMDGVGPGDKKSQARGDKIAMNAIVALGGSPKEARDWIANGRGLWNGDNGQVIWGVADADGSMGVGDHTDHVHVSARKINPAWLPSEDQKRQTVDKLPGPWDGARTMVRQITGKPNIRGDHAFVEGLGGQQDEVGVHSGTEHNDANAYAQDINSNPGYAENEGEPPFTQESMDTIVANLRSMGADVPDLSYVNNPGWTGQVGSYKVFIEGGISNHIHVGATYVGGGGTPVGGIAGGMSIFEQAKTNRYGGATPAGTTSTTSSGGGGAPAASGQPLAAGAAWDNLQAFRVGSNPNQKVPLWGGGTGEGDGSGDLPMLAESIAKALKGVPQVAPQAKQVSTTSSAGKLGLSTFKPVVSKRKKRNLA